MDALCDDFKLFHVKYFMKSHARLHLVHNIVIGFTCPCVIE